MRRVSILGLLGGVLVAAAYLVGLRFIGDGTFYFSAFPTKSFAQPRNLV